MTMPAAAYNAFVDAAKDYQRRRQGNGGASSIDVRQSGSVTLIKNTSVTDVDRFGILGIDGTVFTPTDLESFKNQFALSGSVPDIALHVGKFAVAIEPISTGEMGLCLVNGMVMVQVDVVAESDSFAEITDDDATCLTSGPSGCAQILWKESGTGKKWAVVRIGASGASGTHDNPKILGGSGTDVDTGVWDIDAQGQDGQGNPYHGVEFKVFRLYWSGVAGEAVYQFIRTPTYDSIGRLVGVSAEVRSVAFGTGNCQV